VGVIAVRKAKVSALSAEQDHWIRRAYVAAADAAKDVVGATGPIRPNAPIGRLSDSEWGWICSAVVWAWVATRAEQAATEGLDVERTIRETDLAPDPWTAGAVASILPQLFEACPDLDWGKAVGEWEKDDIVAFLVAALDLVQRALAARDTAEEQVAGKVTNADVVARQMNGAAGNPRMTPAEHKELDNEIPF
jgi:hypothetical protein